MELDDILTDVYYTTVQVLQNGLYLSVVISESKWTLYVSCYH